MPEMTQPRQAEWSYQWDNIESREAWLFKDWIFPNRLEDFAGKTVLDAGCGAGFHAELAAGFARKVVAVDLNTADITRQKTKKFPNIQVLDGNIATVEPGEQFDVVYCVGVVQHTSDPDATVKHLSELVKPGGRLILWVYSHEGNALVRWIVEPMKTVLVQFMPRSLVMALGHAITAPMYGAMYSIYLLPLPFLPFYEFLNNSRRLSYMRNVANVFDKLNAPITHFIRRQQAERWMVGFKDVHISPYMGVSWRVSGTK